MFHYLIYHVYVEGREEDEKAFEERDFKEAFKAYEEIANEKGSVMEMVQVLIPECDYQPERGHEPSPGWYFDRTNEDPYLATELYRDGKMVGRPGDRPKMKRRKQ